MKSLWDDQKADALAADPLALRVYRSRLLGGDQLVLHGGGNTSVKAKVKNFFGDDEEVLYVKGSGWDLGTIEAPGFAPVRLNVPLRLAEMATLSDTDMVEKFAAVRCSTLARRRPPSKRSYTPLFRSNLSITRTPTPW